MARKTKTTEPAGTQHKVTGAHSVYAVPPGHVVTITDPAQRERLQRSGAIGPELSAAEVDKVDEERVASLVEAISPAEEPSETDDTKEAPK